MCVSEALRHQCTPAMRQVLIIPQRTRKSKDMTSLHAFALPLSDELHPWRSDARWAAFLVQGSYPHVAKSKDTKRRINSGLMCRADIATVAAAGSVGAAPAAAAPAAAAPAPAAASSAAAPAAAPRPAGDRVVASPMAKSLAAERGINLADVAGTGPDGRITAADVENHKAGSGAPKAEKKKDEGPKIGEQACLALCCGA